MIIDFKKHDSKMQIMNLQDLLFNQKPSEENLALAMFIAVMIFHQNRPGKLVDYKSYDIHGTGCHNPTSEKDGKIVRNVWRLEVTISNSMGANLEIKHEWVDGGYLKAIFNNGRIKHIITADVFIHKKWFKNQRTAKLHFATCKQFEIATRDIGEFLKDPLDELLRKVS